MKRAEQGIRRTERETERDRLRFERDRASSRVYVNWLKQIDWKLFCTFTFAWTVSDQQADRTFSAFINRLERSSKCDVGYIRGDEKRLSGCGKPASGRHYHALLTGAAPLHPALVEWHWMEMAGRRSDHAGAKVEPYDSAQNGVQYVLKFINKVDGDWKFGRLELFHPEARGLQTPRKRLRRHLQRHKARYQKFATAKSTQSDAKIAIVCTATQPFWGK